MKSRIIITTAILAVSLAVTAFISALVSYAQDRKVLEGDFNQDGIVDAFEKQFLEKGIHPSESAAKPNQKSSFPVALPLSRSPVEITIDCAQQKEEFSKYLFTTALESDENSFKLAQEANFQAVSFIQFDSSDIIHFGSIEQKMYLLDKYNLAGVLYLEKEGERPLTQAKMETQIDVMLDKINKLEKKYPDARINVFLFGNEPNFPFAAFNMPAEAWHWKGTQKQFFQNYEMFARYLKSKNKNYIVGTPGFAPANYTAFSALSSDWPEKLIKYVYEHDVPLDFISFHSYSAEIKFDISDQIDKLNSLLDKYPVKSQIFGRPKIANNEYDIRGQVLTDTTYYSVYDTVWRASHNVLAELAMMDKNVWLASEWAGPVQLADKNALYDISMAWIKNDGTVKPVYYGHRLLNSLANNIRLAQSGSNFQTFGAMAGRTKDGKIINIVMANYTEDGLLPGHESEFTYPARQARGLPVYRHYKINIKGLPACDGETLRVEKYLVDKAHNGDLVETAFTPCQQEVIIEGVTNAPDVQLIKITSRNSLFR